MIDRWCDASLTYITLRIDGSWSPPITVTTPFPQHHRVYISKRCEGFRIETRVYSGDLRIRISNLDPTPGPLYADSAVLLESQNNYNICPGSAYYSHGTFAILAEPLTTFANYSIRVVSIPPVSSIQPAPGA